MLPGLTVEECTRLDGLFEQLIDVPPAAREAVLATLQGEQPSLHAQLVQMLALAEQPDAELDPQRVDRRAAWQALAGTSQTQTQPGERIGAWRLLRPLGRGSMGEVYEVARADGAYEQRGALKLILGEVGSHGFPHPFARERQILAELDHPGISRLLDGGADACSRQYLVTEFVAGVSIDQYCAAQCLE